MGSVVPIVLPFIKKVATNFLVSTITNKVFGSKNTSSYSGAFSSEQAVAGVQEASAILVNKNSNNASLPILFGRRRVGGTRILVETTDYTLPGTDKTTGTDQLVMCLALGDAPDLWGWPTRLWFDDELVWDINDATNPGYLDNGGGFNPNLASAHIRGFMDGGVSTYKGGNVDIIYHRGGGVAVNTGFFEGYLGSDIWSSNHRLECIPHLEIALYSNPEYYEGAVPVITVEVDGNTTMPVTQAFADAVDKDTYYRNSSLWQYSAPTGANPVDALFYYMTDEFNGKGLAFNAFTGLYEFDWVDWPSWVAARAYCEELVDRGAGPEKRYEINGLLQTNSTVYDNIDMLVNSFNGMLIYSGGKYILKIRNPNETSVMSFNRDNLIGNIEVTFSQANNRLNRISISYANPEINYNDDIVVVFDQVAHAADNYKILEEKIDQPLITNKRLITELAQYKIDSSRQVANVSFTAPHTAMALECGEIIDITHDMFNWSGKLFRVIQLEILADNTVDVTAIEYNPSIEL